MICDDINGRHWLTLANGYDHGRVHWMNEYFFNGFCGHKGAITTWADVDGDGMADIICDDSVGNHYIRTTHYC